MRFPALYVMWDTVALGVLYCLLVGMDRAGTSICAVVDSMLDVRSTLPGVGGWEGSYIAD